MEVWKTIKGYEGRYLVSNEGNIMNCYTGNLIKCQLDRYGYLLVNLTSQFGRKTHLVHRIVAHAFIEKPIGFNEINHINEIKTDNRVENLEWVSHRENLQKYWDNHPERKSQVSSYYKKHPNAKKKTKLSNIEVIQFDLQNRQVNKWKDIATIHKILGYHNTSIYECCVNKRHTAYGYKWQFAIDIQNDIPSQ